ncbi:hypothetical protein N657DRAFT_97894 [Parathielavia appendiculata]|uniref:Uncharacterized protein n=1 Tax=Parathielavia appendiculata TaxID=2587402 RepID=A0AAN6TXB5_9PEZI|nr:hypothetical protein N657DRAFT_97894 [Parathielavia appendiculata]
MADTTETRAKDHQAPANPSNITASDVLPSPTPSDLSSAHQLVCSRQVQYRRSWHQKAQQCSAAPTRRQQGTVIVESPPMSYIQRESGYVILLSNLNFTCGTTPVAHEIRKLWSPDFGRLALIAYAGPVRQATHLGRASTRSTRHNLCRPCNCVRVALSTTPSIRDDGDPLQLQPNSIAPARVDCLLKPSGGCQTERSDIPL